MINKTLPAQYAWLKNENAPKILLEALRLHGTLESPGASDNREILAWARECGISGYAHDSIAWCGLFAAVVVKRAGYQVVNAPLWAANWSKFGTKVSVPMLGDVLVFKRPGGNHVGVYVGEDDTAYHVLGGNQTDSVRISRIEKSRLTHARRSPFAVGQPANVRRVILAANGAISTNEA